MLRDKAGRHDLGRIGSELKTDTDVVMQWRKRKSVAPRREGLPSNPKPQTKLTLGQSCGTRTSGRVGDQVREAVTRRYGVLSSNEHAANGRCTGAPPALVVQEGTDIGSAKVARGMEVVSADTTRTDGYAHGDSALARTTTGTALNERRAMHRAVRNAANAPEQRLVEGQARTLSVGETPRAPTSVAHDRRQVDDFVEDSRKRQERVRAQIRAHRHALHCRDHRRRRRTERIERCRAAVEVGRKDRMGREAT